MFKPHRIVGILTESMPHDKPKCAGPKCLLVMAGLRDDKSAEALRSRLWLVDLRQCEDRSVHGPHSQTEHCQPFLCFECRSRVDEDRGLDGHAYHRQR
jgi:hypothetical protein